MAMCVTLEKLTYVIRGNAQEVEEVWTPLMDFLRQLWIIFICKTIECDGDYFVVVVVFLLYILFILFHFIIYLFYFLSIFFFPKL